MNRRVCFETGHSRQGARKEKGGFFFCGLVLVEYWLPFFFFPPIGRNCSSHLFLLLLLTGIVVSQSCYQSLSRGDGAKGRAVCVENFFLSFFLSFFQQMLEFFFFLIEGVQDVEPSGKES